MLIFLVSSNFAFAGREEIYRTGYNLGKALAEKHGIHKGSSYIERECAGFVSNYIGDSPNSDNGINFRMGCVMGYNSYFGK